MSKNITIDVYFEVFCSCGNVLIATYDDRRKELTVEPCECCLQQAREKTEERIKDDRS